MMYVLRTSLLSLRRSFGGRCVLAVISVLWFLGAAVAGDEAHLDAKLNESVCYVPVGSWPSVKLQVTIFEPDGRGPFPVAVLNHGKATGRPCDEPRYRSVYAARYFLSRGYAVILPMTRGFAGSGGETWLRGCNIEEMGIQQARDISDVIRYLSTRPDLDTTRIVLFGQSVGGFAALALGTLEISGVKCLVNFAGGINAPSCPAWQEDLVIAAGNYGQRTRAPSIWFYGDNDSKFPPPVWRAMFERYTAAGGHAELEAYGPFMEDSHNFLGKIEALPVWVPKLDAFLARAGLPGENLHPELLPAPYPKATRFAAIDDVAAVPLINEKGRQDYREFLKKAMPRVFVVATNGSCISTDGGYDPLARAKSLCKQHNLRCQVYAVDDQVVWPISLPVPPATKYAQLEDAHAVPYLDDRGRQAYQRFLTLGKPRAFVIAPDGCWTFSSRDFDVLASALQSCRKNHQGCKVYAVDDQVVW